MTEETEAHFEKARQALDTARLALDAGDADGCTNRAYYAALHAALAALVVIGETPQSHKGAHNRFWVHFVETGQVSPEVGRVLPYAQQMRRQADYEAFSRFDTNAAADLLKDVEAFVATIEALVRDQNNGRS